MADPTRASPMDDLLARELEGHLPPFFLFWGHTSKTGAHFGPWMLSQWWPSRFTVEEVDYFHAEGYMMAAKARLFDDSETLARILAAEDPSLAKHLGRMVKNFDQAEWVAHRYEIVLDGSWAKFSQDPQLASYLRSTEPAVLVEASPRDRIWGIGLGANNPKAQLPSQWRGQNLLGFALTEIRHQLHNQSPERSG